MTLRPMTPAKASTRADPSLPLSGASGLCPSSTHSLGRWRRSSQRPIESPSWKGMTLAPSGPRTTRASPSERTLVRHRSVTTHTATTSQPKESSAAAATTSRAGVGTTPSRASAIAPTTTALTARMRAAPHRPSEARSTACGRPVTAPPRPTRPSAVAGRSREESRGAGTARSSGPARRRCRAPPRTGPTQG